ncbi:hypothetical protein KKA03_07135, partial [archaeon]|nr:hypothetical protein [archaeon]
MGNGPGWYGETMRHREAALKGRSRNPPDRKVDSRAYSLPEKGRRRFETLGDRDRFINTYFTERECAEDVPGLYNLQDGGWLGVR